MTESEKIECPTCGEDTVKILKKTHHSSRSSYSGGTTIKLLTSKCDECGLSDLKKKLERKGWNVTQ